MSRRRQAGLSVEAALADLRAVSGLHVGSVVEVTHADHTLRLRLVGEHEGELSILRSGEMAAFVTFDESAFAEELFEELESSERLRGEQKTVYRGRL